MTTTQQLVKVFTTYFTSRGYHKTKSEKFELHSKPYITVDTEQEAIQILVTRKISKILECCNSNDLDIDNSVLYNNYVLVFPTGDFIGLAHCKISPQKHKENDYVWVCTGKNKYEQSHRVVAKCFIPNINNYPCINHKNGIKYDNRVDNLEWCTYSENTKHAYKTGLERKISGTEHHASKLTSEDVIYIRKKYVHGHKYFGRKALSKKFNVNESTIYDIVHYKTYKEIV